MSFYDLYNQYKGFEFEQFFSKVTAYDIERIIHKDKIGPMDFLALLSEKAEEYLELMAQRAYELTRQQFGKAIVLYTPMYLGNFCVNQCVYCGYNVINKIPRKKLMIDEVEEEARSISSTGLRHILILTGESRKYTPVSYIKECVEVLKKYFTSIAIEVYPLEQEEYAELIEAGVDGLTLYQEVYDEEVYDQLHKSGPKKNYHFRLDGPERGCKAKMRSVGIGALLGLDNWRKEAFFTGLHGDYLQNQYPDTEISISLPRMRPHTGGYEPQFPLDDKGFVQILLASRLFMPRAGINVSTREKAEFREHILPLGVTKISAGVTTAVGGHTQGEESAQFDISDGRSVKEIRDMLLSKGYQPVFKDWQWV